MSDHVHEDSLLSFILGSGDPEVSDHLSSCDDCAARSVELASIVGDAPPVDVRPHLVAAYAGEILRNERERSNADAEAFLRDPASFSGPWTVALLRLVIQGIDSEIDHNPRRALELAAYAVDAAAALDAKTCARGIVSGIRGDAWKVRAYALHAQSRHSEADECLDRAEEHYEETVTSDFDIATVDYARSMIARDAGRLDEAVAMLQRAREVFGRYGDSRRIAHTELVRGAIEFRRANYAAAGTAFAAVAELNVDAATTGHALLNRVYAAMHEGEHELASRLIAQAEEIFAALERPLEVARSQWCKARLDLINGDCETSLSRLFVVRDRFAESSMAEEAGLATLDIVEAHLAFENYADAKREAARAADLFRSVKLNDRTRVALQYLTEAIGRGGAYAEQARFVRDFVDGVLRGQEREFTLPVSLTTAN